MKTVGNNQFVSHAWAHQTQKSARSGNGNFSFAGKELRSYYTTIAYHFGEFILMSKDRFSLSTGTHLNLAWSATRDKRHIDSSIFQWGKQFSWEAPTPAQILEDMDGRMLNLMMSYPKKRTDSTRFGVALEVKQIADDINYIIEFFKVDRAPAVCPYDVEELKAKAYAAQEKRYEVARANALKRQEKLRADNAELIEKWLNGENVHLPYGLGQINGTNLLTIRGDKVHTSEGAEVPLSHVKKALQFYYSLKLRTPGVIDGVWSDFEPWRTNGHKVHLGVFTLDSIDEGGTVRAGCHVFSASEINRFVKKWGLETAPVE